MTAPASLLLIQFLAWVASRTRSYAEARQAWHSTCPMGCAWEDAISDGLIAFANPGGGGLDRTTVLLTPRGRALLERQGAHCTSAPASFDFAQDEGNL